MGASLNVRDLADQDLYDLFASADEHQDEQLCRLCIDEIERRCHVGPAVTLEAPAMLKPVLRLFSHQARQKSGGGGG